MRRIGLGSVSAILLLWLAGCQCGQPNRLADTSKWGVGHAVMFWLKQPGDADTRRRIIEASRGFEKLPGVVSVRAGEILASPRPNVDKSYDVAVVIFFRDQGALEAYQIHPLHKQMLQQLGPLIDHTAAYDFTPLAPVK